MKDILKGLVVTTIAVAISYWVSLRVVNLYIALWFVPVSALLAPLLMPNLKWLAGCATFFVLGIGALAIQHTIAVSSANYNGSPGEGLGLASLMFTGVGASFGVLVRVVAHFVGPNVFKPNKPLKNDARQKARAS